MTCISRLLLIVSDTALARLLTQVLGEQGFVLDTHAERESGAAMAASGGYDLVVVDVPSVVDFDVLGAIRAQSTVPIVLLTAYGDGSDGVAGLELGADDFVRKPFGPAELVGRIRAVLRRARGSWSGATRPGLHRLDGLVLDPASRSVSRNHTIIDLTAVEFDLLLTLIVAAGSIVSREVLVEAALGRRFEPTDRSLDMHISNLRRKLGPRATGEPPIKTVRGVGYMYTLPGVEE